MVGCLFGTTIQEMHLTLDQRTQSPGATSLQYRNAVQSDSKANSEEAAMVLSPLSDATLKMMYVIVYVFYFIMIRDRFDKFNAASKQPDSWSMMQTMNLLVDRVSLLKEEHGQYYQGTGKRSASHIFLTTL